MSVIKNIFSEIPDGDSTNEFLQEIFTHESLRIERIISTGQVSPDGFWYDQDEQEWVILLDGEASLEFEDLSRINLNKGDYLFIPAHQKHRVVYTSVMPPCCWLAAFFK